MTLSACISNTLLYSKLKKEVLYQLSMITSSSIPSPSHKSILLLETNLTKPMMKYMKISLQEVMQVLKEQKPHEKLSNYL